MLLRSCNEAFIARYDKTCHNVLPPLKASWHGGLVIILIQCHVRP
jgi:hypothetical protein